MAAYLRTLEGRNRRSATILAYRTDIGQFIAWLHETNLTIDTPDGVERLDVAEYLAHLPGRGLSGVSRARKPVRYSVRRTKAKVIAGSATSDG